LIEADTVCVDLARLDLPRIDLVDAGLLNATIAEVMRWAMRIHEGWRIVA
jgi:hypothetical protein